MPLERGDHAFSQPRTSFVGRREELDRLHLWLDDDERPLITVVGPGGVGKTRLVLESTVGVNDRFRDGVIFVALATVLEPSDVPQAIARACELLDSPTGDNAGKMLAYLRDRHALLVLDNFEHVTGASGIIQDILQTCPGVRILVTSRIRLRIDTEQVFELDPLPLPSKIVNDSLSIVASFASVELFVQRVQSVNPGFALGERNAATVAAICIRLDGLPLAIELAAARTRVISTERILELLDTRMELLSHGPIDSPVRLQSMRAAIEWSYRLLSPHLQEFFRRCSIFIGGWDIDGASAIATGLFETTEEIESNQATKSQSSDDISLLALISLESLIDHSLLRRMDGPVGIARFTMLETLREFGIEELVRTGDYDGVALRHVLYCIRLGEAGTRELTGPRQFEWLERLDADHPNIRVALSRCEVRGDAANGLRLCNAISWYWRVRGMIAEAHAWFESFLAMPSMMFVADGMRATSLRWVGELTGLQGYAQEADAYLAESLAIYRRTDDRRGIAGALSATAITRIQSGRSAESIDPFLEAADMYREFGDLRRVAFFESYSAVGMIDAGDIPGARRTVEQALELAHSLGDPRSFEVAFGELILALVHVVDDQLDDAVLHARVSIHMAEELSSLLILPTACTIKAMAEIGLGQTELAWSDIRMGAPISIETGFRLATGGMVAAMTIMAARDAAWERTAQLVGLLDQLGGGYRTILQGRIAAELQMQIERAQDVLGDDAFSTRRLLGSIMPVTFKTLEELGPFASMVTMRSPQSILRELSFTNRQLQVLRMLVDRKTDAEIGEAMDRSSRTASDYVSEVLKKLHVSSRSEAAVLAIRWRLV